jgi:hypothetical protein
MHVSVDIRQKFVGSVYVGFTRKLNYDTKSAWVVTYIYENDIQAS